MEVTGKKVGTLSFQIDQNGHTYILDAPESVGGDDSGPSPKGLLLSGLIGCTGIDVALLLKKMRVEYDNLEIKAETELTEEEPKVFKEITLSYYLNGDENDIKKIRKAVNLSMDKYCGVSAMLEKNSPIVSKIYLNRKEID